MFVGNGTDFDSSTREITLPRRTVRRNVFIPIIDDNISEPVENFSLRLELDPLLSSMGVIVGEPAMTTVFIVDNDEGMYSLCCVCQLEVCHLRKDVTVCEIDNTQVSCFA